MKEHELAQLSTAESGTPRGMLLAMLELQKLARTSRTSFLRYWPPAISIARILASSNEASLPERAVAYGLLSFDRLFHCEFDKAMEWALRGMPLS